MESYLAPAPGTSGPQQNAKSSDWIGGPPPSKGTAKIAAALARAQNGYATLTKSKTANAGTYTYQYADLSDLLNCTREALAKNELALTQLIQGSVLKTILLHSSGESLEAFMDLPRVATPQQFGSALTYARRYSAGAILGISGEEDDDGAAAEKAKSQTTRASNSKTEQKKSEPPKSIPKDPGDFEWNYGKQKGTKLRNIPWAQITDFKQWADKQTKRLDPEMSQLKKAIDAFVAAAEISQREPGAEG